MGIHPEKPLMRLIEKNQSKRVVEIGVLKGRTTRKILRSHCKDIIEEYWATYEYLKNMKQSRWDRFYQKLCVYSFYFPSLKVLRMTSATAANLFAESICKGKDGYFDLVFIDANHDYDHVKEDILLWTPLIKSGGLLIGHDYGNPDEEAVAVVVHELFGDDVELDKENYIWIRRIK
ncbi:MAG: class I SAM-dependent methyltransferase [Promethearchaeota archaeon]|jgi:hypothetical protein